jgi:CubicO group peptidase (beta-lactamase class C family)
MKGHVRWIAASTLIIFTSPLSAAPPADFDARVGSLRTKIGVPGMAVVIVENGVTTLAHGYGVTKMGGDQRVDADTIFPTGSTGKAFTTAALATLVDAGKIGWDDKVIDRLPGFQMYDPWVTREMTIRDLLVHRSGLGLGAGDLMFVPRGSISRAEAVKRLRYIKPATSFRSGYAYDNVLYMVAGQLIEAVSGQTWEDYMREHVLARAGMTNSTSDNDRRFATANRGFPHARTTARVRGVGPLQPLDERDELGRAASPAGGLAVSANDMGKWLTLQLARGKLPGGGTLFSEAAHAEMWKPQVVMTSSRRSEELKLAESMFETYALGWRVHDYRGTKLVSHGGAVFGFQAVVVLVPDRNLGFAVEINSEDGEIILGLMYELLDHYLGFAPYQWPEKFSAYKQERLAQAMKALEAPEAKPARVGPSLPLERYAGIYADPWYGNIDVAIRNRALTIDFKSTPRMGGRLEHWQYDTFITRFDDKNIEPAYVTFGLDADGRVERVTMKPVSPLADFSYDYADLLFKPQKPPEAPAE